LLALEEVISIPERPMLSEGTGLIHFGGVIPLDIPTNFGFKFQQEILPIHGLIPVRM
jgi:hypothetical protein